VAFVLGASACASGDLTTWSLVAALALVVAVLAHGVNPFGLALLSIFACLGWARLHFAHTPQSPNDIRLHQDSRGQVLLYGRTVGESDVRSDETRWVFRVDSIAYPDSVVPRWGRVLARFRFDPGIQPNSNVKLAGRLIPPQSARNPGDFSWSDTLKRRGLHGLFEPATGSPVLSASSLGPSFLGRVVAPLRRTLKSRLGAHLDGEERALAAGLFLGERDQLSQATVDAFKRTGTLHLLAVSGSNVGIVAGAVWGLLLFLRVGRAWRLAGSAACVALFCCLAHLEASVVRAGLAALVVLGAVALRRRVDPLHVWGLALLAFTVWQPVSILDLGFQLSFAATLGILLLPEAQSSGSRGKVRRILRVICTCVLVSTAAQLATLPTMLAVFHEVPLVTPLANLICVPLAGLATLSAMLVVILAPIGEPLLSVTSAALWVCIKGLLLAVHAVDGLAVPILAVPRPGTTALVLMGASVLSVFGFANRPKDRRRIAIGSAVAVCGALLLAYTPVEPEVVVLDGPRLEALVRLSGYETWRIGAPSDRPPDPANRASLALGWPAPRGSLSLEGPVEPEAGTSRKTGPYPSAERSAEPSAGPSLTVWCRSHDSLPFGAVVDFSGRQVVICREWPGAPPDRLGVGPDAIWITDAPFPPPPFCADSEASLVILAGRSPGREKPLDVQVLHTRRHGSVRILWRDRGFQTEPRVR